MFNAFYYIIIFIVFTTNLYSDNNSTVSRYIRPICDINSSSINFNDINKSAIPETNYIDISQQFLSGKVIDYSRYIDDTLCNVLSFGDNNITYKKKLKSKKEDVDTFFQSDKFIEETDETFVSLRLEYDMITEDINKFSMGLSARLPLSSSRKRFNIFIDGVNQDNLKKVTSSDKSKSRPEIGINYFAPVFNTIKSRYSIGFHGINPFTSARYLIKTNFRNWKIEPVQQFRYSTQDRFEEQTDIYFDKELTKSTLFRITLHRKTLIDKQGMDYSISLSNYWLFENKAGLNISQSFLGNTKYRYSTNNPVNPKETKQYDGINNYVTAINFRKSIWRKWLFYDITPSINFQKQYDYKINYRLDFFINLYFGHLR